MFKALVREQDRVVGFRIIEVLGDENRYEDPEMGTVHTGADVWVKVFKMKVKEIEEKRCQMF